MTALNSNNVNSLWCSVLMETLVREGLRFAVISPGSRSTPLTMAAGSHPQVETIVSVDERSAAFHALGLARGSGNPVMLICTSGSAGAHYLPAMIEARETGTPLIAITADRPAELRDCSAGQTINQHQLFGNYATWYHEFAVPMLDESLFVYLRQTTRQAWERARADGPVHLNAPFRDPLPPLPDGGETAEFATQIDEEFWSRPEPVGLNSEIKMVHQVTTSRGMIVSGPAYATDQASYARHVYDLAEATGWPILADGLSPARHFVPPGVTVVSHYDLILRNPTRARELTPRYVLGLESWPTSKALRQWLGQSQAEMLMVSPRSSAGDAVHGRTREITAPISALTFSGAAAKDTSYAKAWQAAQTTAANLLETWFNDENQAAFEGHVSRAVAGSTGPGHAVVLASSMPVRDWEYFCPAANRGCHVYSSRGANGIDGTFSTALGTARSTNHPTVLITGDLAFLHDSNGLMLAHESAADLTVIVVNNSGGGIFEHLPVARFDERFERLFATPTQVDLGKLCEAHRVRHRRIALSDLNSVLSDRQEQGVRVIEVRTDRKADAVTRKRGFRELANQL